VNSRLIGWGQNEGAFVYDRKLKLVVQLSDLTNFYPTIGVTGIDWLVQPNPNASDPYSNTVEQQINLSNLP